MTAESLEPVGHETLFAKVFSLMRNSELEADDYLTTFFDTGSERQGHTESP